MGNRQAKERVGALGPVRAQKRTFFPCNDWLPIDFVETRRFLRIVCAGSLSTPSSAAAAAP